MHEFFFLAYIDPGSGALLLQTLVAGAVGGLVFFRQLVTDVTSKLFGRKKADGPATDDLNAKP
jgi:hypothetical protein